MEAVDLESVQGHTGSAVLDLEGKVLKASGDLAATQDGAANTLMCLFRIMEDASKCIEDEGLKRITVSFSDCNYILTATAEHVYIVKANV